MPDLGYSDDVIARFWAKVDKRGPDDCWLWTGWQNRAGYGRLDVGRSKVLATHVALVVDGRPRPPAPRDKALHGDCSTPACCNPKHLRWGDSKENAADMVRRGERVPPRGEASGTAKLTTEEVRLIRSLPMSQRGVARVFGVTQALVSKIRRRELWAHVT